MGKFGGMEDRSSRKDSLILDTCFASVNQGSRLARQTTADTFVGAAGA